MRSMLTDYIFKSSNRDFLLNCIGYVDFSLPSDLIENRQASISVCLNYSPGYDLVAFSTTLWGV
jgi:hypothetical protein